MIICSIVMKFLRFLHPTLHPPPYSKFLLLFCLFFDLLSSCICVVVRSMLSWLNTSLPPFAVSGSAVSISSSASSSSISSSSHEVYHNKRSYQKKRKIGFNEEHQLQTANHFEEEDHISQLRKQQKYHSLILPRIIKSDIRRKYLIMFANVMNSYDFQLISSYFHKFFSKDCQLTKVPPKYYNSTHFHYDSSHTFPASSSSEASSSSSSSSASPSWSYSYSTSHPTAPLSHKFLVKGVELLIPYFSFLLQLSPDKITRCYDIQLKQSSEMEEGYCEIISSFNVSYTRLYDVTPNQIIPTLPEVFQKILQGKAEVDLKEEERNQLKEFSTILTQDPKKDHAKALCDPLNTEYCASKFPRLSTPSYFNMFGSISMLINKEKQIEQILFKPADVFIDNVKLEKPSYNRWL
jgi:hypothetical protein